MRLLAAGSSVLALIGAALAQTAPTADEIRIYAGLHEAAAKGDVAEIEKLIAEGERPNIQDSRSRTPLHVAAYLKRHDAARALIKLGANAERAGDRPLRHRHHRGGGERHRDAQARA